MDVLLNDRLDRPTKHHEIGIPPVLTDISLRGISTVELFGQQLICCDCRVAAKWIAEVITHPRTSPLILTHVNAHSLRCLSRISEPQGISQMLLLEGIGLKAACLITKGWAPVDTNGTDLLSALLDQLRGTSCRLFLLGSEAHVATLAAQKIKERWPNVEIVGCRDGYFTENEIPAIRDEVRRAKPTLLLIGLGSPRQEAVAVEFLQVPDLQVIWTVGGLFDRLAGRIPRAPSLMLALRLEWLFRIFVEPRRLAWRYFIDALWLVRSCVYEWLKPLKIHTK